MSAQTAKSRGFLENVLWSWIGVVASFATATLLAPFLFLRLGDEAYGIWSLTFSIIEYFGLLDFGFKSAIIKNAGHFRAQDDVDGINTVLNSALAYFASVAALLCGVTLLLATLATAQFQISPGYLPDFRLLLLTFGISWACGLCFTTFTASLEAFQRFDLSSRIAVINTVLRTCSIAVLLSMGYGLRGAAAAAVCCQWILYLLSLGTFLHVYPAFRLSTSLVSRDMLMRLGRFGWDTLPSTAAWLMLLQGPALLVGQFRPAAFVGYYMVAHRLVQTSLELVWRVGSVTNAKTAELASHGKFKDIARLAERANRFCFALYAPIALGAIVYGDRLLATWYSPRLADQSGLALLLLASTAWFAEAGQFNSSSILFGLGRQRAYSRLLLAEAIVTLGGMILAIGRYGLTGVASAAAVCMLVNRGIILPWLTSRILQVPLVRFWVAIHARTLAAAAAAAAFGWAIRSTILPGRSLIEVLFASGLIAAFYIVLAFTWALPVEERDAVVSKIRGRLGR
jgi:O-antigen/teichoic acid export membrane protein